MIKERYGIKQDDGTIPIISVDDILESYEIKDLSLESLQEKYVDMVDNYEEKIDELNTKYETLNDSISDLNKTIINSTSETIENQATNNENINISHFTFFSILLIVFIISFYIGKYYKKSNNN